MNISCVWEHNGDDTILYARDYPGAFARGENLEEAKRKMPGAVAAYLRWRDGVAADSAEPEIVQEKASELNIRDADSDVLFDSENSPMTREEYEELKALALRSAVDFQALYDSIPGKDHSCLPRRQTFYGPVPRTAGEMYVHTRSVNAYYFAEIEVDVDNEGTILECRRRGFAALEQIPGFLEQEAQEGSYGEWWSLRKVLRRFLWHDRIHARAMVRMAVKTFGKENFTDPFGFG